VCFAVNGSPAKLQDKKIHRIVQKAAQGNLGEFIRQDPQA
jgi:hypothetical protein